MTKQVYNVLFLCTHNSARSIMAESLINFWGQGKFRGFSAGSHPFYSVNPLTLELLDRLNMPIQGLRSKNWDEFNTQQAPRMDFVFTVCDKAAAEVCPAWPGQPMTAHWGVPDPVAVKGDDIKRMQAFRQAFRELEHRIRIFTSLPIGEIDRLRLQERLNEIGRSTLQEATVTN